MEYSFSQAELDEFLAQSTPRTVPDALLKQTASSTGDLIGIIAGAGAIVLLPVSIGPLFLWPKTGLWAVLLSLIGTTISVFVGRMIWNWIKSLPTLLKDGLVAIGRFEEVEFEGTHRELGNIWTATIVFEVDGRQTRIVRQVREAYGDYANQVCRSGAEILVLYFEKTPHHARWTGEFVHPCPPADH